MKAIPAEYISGAMYFLMVNFYDFLKLLAQVHFYIHTLKPNGAVYI